MKARRERRVENNIWLSILARGKNGEEKIRNEGD